MTGSGTLLDPYIIWDVFDLQNVNLDYTAWYELGQDIDATVTVGWNGGLGFNPIGDQLPVANRFRGHFDGRGHSITNLFINRPLERYIGLFGFCEDQVTIRNVSLVNINFTGRGYMGGLVGQTQSVAPPGIIVGLIQSCYVLGGIITGGSENYLGGLVGLCEYIAIRDSYATCNVTGDCDQMGGLLGEIGASDVTNCYATGNVTGTGTMSGCGGFVGYVDQVTTFRDCSATGNVTGLFYVGGFAGHVSRGTFTNCYATGNVSGNAEIGGFVGSPATAGIPPLYQRCHATGIVSVAFAAAPNYFGGFAGSIVNCEMIECYATGDVNTPAAVEVGGFGAATNPDGLIRRCYCTGNVSGDAGVGGFLEINLGVIENCYCHGNVVGNIGVGGFIAENQNIITNCYCTGQVTGPTDIGGFCVINGGTITNCFWDITTSGQTTSAGGQGEITATMKQMATFANAGWDIQENSGADFGNGYPWLSWQVPGSSPIWYILPSAVPPAPVTVVTLPATEIR